MADNILGNDVGNVICVEPSADIIPTLERNRNRTGTHFSILHGAVQPVSTLCRDVRVTMLGQGWSGHTQIETGGSGRSVRNATNVPCFDMRTIVEKGTQPLTVLFADCEGCLTSAMVSRENLVGIRAVIYENDGHPADAAAALQANDFQLALDMARVRIWLRIDESTSLWDYSLAWTLPVIFTAELSLSVVGGTTWMFCSIACWVLAFATSAFLYELQGMHRERKYRRVCFASAAVVIWAYFSLGNVQVASAFWGGTLLSATLPLLAATNSSPLYNWRNVVLAGLPCLLYAGFIAACVLFPCYKHWRKSKPCRDWNGDVVPSATAELALARMLAMGFSICWSYLLMQSWGIQPCHIRSKFFLGPNNPRSKRFLFVATMIVLAFQFGNPELL